MTPDRTARGKLGAIVIVLRVLVFAAGVAIVFLTLRSAIRTFLVPRALQAVLSRVVFVSVRRVFWLRANHRHDYRQRDKVMAFYAPVSLLTLLVVWLVLVFVGYTAIFWALEAESLSRALALAGSSLFTLGLMQGEELSETLFSFTAAAIGLFLLALLITYLPSLYAALARREAGVSKLEVRAGRPPSGVYLLQLAWEVGRLDSLHGLWLSWQSWFNDVDQSHSSFPALVFFRSLHADESWVTAAGTILDAASIYASTIDSPREPEAEYMIRSGYLCLRHIADFFWIPVDHDPAPTDPISITREEFDTACELLDEAGVPLKPDRDQAWRNFAGWRVNYDAALIGLARLTMAPPAPWSSDRYPDAHYIPPALPWLSRSRRSAVRDSGQRS
jgi:hypothetical protein